MKKTFSIFILSLFLFFCHLTSIEAISPPLSVSNNYFGIHISDQSDLEEAQSLVNGNGGSWGYVTVVIRDDDLDLLKWQSFFDEMRRRELIPLVRLATHQKENGWEKPTPEDSVKWAEFLSKLNWVVKNRYIILFNEPNHAKEWGGKISPEEYSLVVESFHKSLKEKSQDFFVISAGFDMAAPKSSETMDALVYFDRMYKSNAKVFEFFDGWSSHSYPNPGFTADPLDVGRKSIRSYQGEVETLVRLGLKKDIPIFITETGWIHKEGVISIEAPDETQVSEYFKYSFENAWKHPQVVAVTPFILNYPNPPFDHFSWKKSDGTFYKQYETVRQMPKTKGNPLQINSYTFVNDAIPTLLIADSLYSQQQQIKNTGQKIWYEGEVTVEIKSDFGEGEIVVSSVSYTESGDETTLNITFNTGPLKEKKKFRLQLFYLGKPFGEPIEREISIIPPSSLTLKAPLAFKLVNHESRDTKLLIYEDNVKLVKTVNDVIFVKGFAKIRELHDVIPGKVYRVVLVKPGYLPSQKFEYFGTENTEITFPMMLPLDYDKNGEFTLSDFMSFLVNPSALFTYIFPFN